MLHAAALFQCRVLPQCFVFAFMIVHFLQYQNLHELIEKLTDEL